MGVLYRSFRRYELFHFLFEYWFWLVSCDPVDFLSSSEEEECWYSSNVVLLREYCVVVDVELCQFRFPFKTLFQFFVHGRHQFAWSAPVRVVFDEDGDSAVFDFFLVVFSVEFYNHSVVFSFLFLRFVMVEWLLATSGW